MIDIRKDAGFPTRLAALAVGITALLCVIAPSAQGLIQHNYHGYALGAGGEGHGRHSRHTVGNMAVYQGSGSATVCEGARYSNSFTIVRQTCGVNGAGNALNMEAYYGSSVWPFIRNPGGSSIGSTVGRQYEDWSTLFPGERMYRDKNSNLYSRNGVYRLTQQWDGNLVLYRHGRPDACWHTHSEWHPGSYTMMQYDGNLVVYDGSAAGEHGSPYWWHAGTNGNPGAHLRLQNDGNLVVYRPNGTAAWNSGTVGC